MWTIQSQATSTLRKPFKKILPISQVRTCDLRKGRYAPALIGVTRVGFQVILKIKCHNVIERQEL